ncbi:MAG: lasso peptide biosynthesis B2 protein [Pseudomonadota bacterium]
MNTLKKFAELAVTDRLLLVVTAFLLVFLAAALRLTSLQTLLNASRRASETYPRWVSEKRWSSGRIVWAVSAVVRRIPALGNCLSVALTAKLLLSATGHSTSLRIGVAKDDSGKLEAHAWLEDNGTILIGSVNHDRFVPLPVFD